MTVNGLGHDIYDKFNSGYYARHPKPRDDYLSLERAVYRKKAFASEEVDANEVVEEVLNDTPQFAELYDTSLKHHQRQVTMRDAGITLGMGIVSDSIKDAVVTGIQHPTHLNDDELL